MSTLGWGGIGRSSRNLSVRTLVGRYRGISRIGVRGRRWNLSGSTLGGHSIRGGHIIVRTIVNTTAGRMIFRRTQLTRINTRRIKLNRNNAISRTLARRLDRNRNTITATRHKRTKRRRRNNNTARRIKNRRILASSLSQRILIRRVNPTNAARVTRHVAIMRTVRERTTNNARSASRRQRRSRQRTRNSRTPRKLNSHRHTNSSIKTRTRKPQKTAPHKEICAQTIRYRRENPEKSSKNRRAPRST